MENDGKTFYRQSPKTNFGLHSGATKCFSSSYDSVNSNGRSSVALLRGHEAAGHCDGLAKWLD